MKLLIQRYFSLWVVDPEAAFVFNIIGAAWMIVIAWVIFSLV